LSLTRREFLRFIAVAGVALDLPAGWERERLVRSCYTGGTAVRTISASPATPLNPRVLDPTQLEPFADSLPLPPVALSGAFRPSPDGSSCGLPFYRIEMREVLRKVHRDLPPTRQWGFEGIVPGPTFETRSGEAPGRACPEIRSDRLPLEFSGPF